MRNNEFVDEGLIREVVGCLNESRTLLRDSKIDEQSSREQLAHRELEEMRASCAEVISTNRGGDKGMHGFLGERAECYLNNAIAIVTGDNPIYFLCDNNGMTDYYYGDLPIQQKACKTGGFCGLNHIKEHADRYPKYNGIYQIPLDIYSEYRRLLNVPREEVNRLSSRDKKNWFELEEFRNKYPNIVIEPMIVNYSDIQKNNIYLTIGRYEDKISSISNERCLQIERKYRPSVKDGVQVATAAGVISAGSSIWNYAVNQYKHGKLPWRYTKEDWMKLVEISFVSFSGGVVSGGCDYLNLNI
ncbi:MAG: hypothetical protein MJ166_09250 [Clostridia bacterium]|nr:hypothetical protein [Clostridia bacterium]